MLKSPSSGVLALPWVRRMFKRNAILIISSFKKVILRRKLELSTFI